MACLAKNCNIKGDDERMVVCWLCHECCHIKCCGISGIVADAIYKHKGLHWCCDSCRSIGVNYYRFFQDTKNKFTEIQQEAFKLNERISAYGKLFEEFKSLDNLKSPPQSSPKRRKSARNINKEKRIENASVTATSSNNSNVAQQHPVPDIHEGVMEVSELTYAEAVLHSRTENNQNNILQGVDINPSPSETTVHNTLRAVPPKKFIFVSRLLNNTTADDVNSYIKNKIVGNTDISVQKFNFSQPRSISSFKITVISDHFETLLDPNFWPMNTLVREYIFRTNTNLQGIAALPSQDSSSSKN